MPNNPILHEEVENYVSCCKRLTSSIFARLSFTPEEQLALQFYLDELTGLQAPKLWIPMHDYKPSVWEFIRTSEALLGMVELSRDEVDIIEYWADKLMLELLYCR